jgi:hypothetical protein
MLSRMQATDATTRRAAYGVAVVRMAIGTAFVLAPGRAGRLWGGVHASGPGSAVLARGLGIRDLLLGVGLWRALRRAGGAAEWMWYGVACDVVDGGATWAAYRHLPRTGQAMLPIMAAVTAVDALVAVRLDPSAA